MSKVFVEDKVYKKKDFSSIGLDAGEYENCTFHQCTFLNSDLSEVIFTDCLFENCDFTLAKISGTAFREILFKECKLLGLHFEDCNTFLFSVNFDGCQLNLSSFFKLNLKGTKFTNCSLQEVDFAECNLSNSIFTNCDLMGAIFENSNLIKCDFRSSFNYSINPELNRIKNAKFAVAGLPGLLDKYNIDIE